jgi:hypothetical protein
VLWGVTLCNSLREVPNIRTDLLLLIQGTRVSDETASSERTVHIYEITRRHTPEDSTTRTSNRTDWTIESKNRTVSYTVVCFFQNEAQKLVDCEKYAPN